MAQKMSASLVLLILVFLSIESATESATAVKYMTHKEIRELLHKSTFDAADPPRFDKPTEVRIGIYVNNVQLDAEAGVMILSMYFRSAWLDERLTALFPSADAPKSIRIKDKDLMMKIWQPDLFVRNSNKAERVDALTDETLMRVNKTGHVWFVNKVIFHLSCPDLVRGSRTIACPFMVESYGYTMDTVYLKWLDSPVDVDKSTQLPSHFLQDLILYDCSQNYTAGAFPCLEIRFLLRTESTALFYASGAYVVSILLVIIAWLGFWIPPSDTRIYLNLGCAVLLSVIYSIVAGWTEYSYKHRANHGQAWFIFCICLVLIMSLMNLMLNMKKGSFRSKVDGLCCREGSPPSPDLEHKRTRTTELVESVFCLILFPATFIAGLLWFTLSSLVANFA